MAAPLFGSPEDSLYQRLLAQLDQSCPTPSGKFLLRYALRNRPGQRGRGVNGVEHLQLLQIYEQALDRTYARFVADGWQEPLPDPRHGVIPVNIGHPDSAPFDPHTVTPGQHSTIWLRSLITEPTVEQMFHRAEVEAVHEVAHVFTHRHRPPGDDRSLHWGWFDEATAVHAERELCGHLAETVRFGVIWCYRPELALNQAVGKGGGYFAAWFVHYLQAQFPGQHLVRDAWHQDNPYMASSVNRRTAECGSFLSLPRRYNRTAVDRLAYGCMGLSPNGVSVSLHQTLIQGSAALAREPRRLRDQGPTPKKLIRTPMPALQNGGLSPEGRPS